MADNMQDGRDWVAADDVGSNLKVPRVKLTFGVDGTATDVKSATPLPVADAAVLTALQALLAGLGALVVDADGRTLVAAESGTLFSNEGATARDDFVLPAAAAGLRFGFIVQDADGIRVTAAAGDTIQVAADVSAVAGRIDSTAIGSTVQLIALNDTEWMAISVTGTWVVT